MNRNQQEFYRSVSLHYSNIFPYNPVQMQMIKKYATPLSEQNILDIGCATGELSFQLAKAGAEVIGIDLNSDLLQQAEKREKLPNLKFCEMDMIKIGETFAESAFDTTICFGNTLVHLSSTEEILQTLIGIFKTLKPGGLFLLQILNYDYILKDKITQLPTIENEKIQFIRNYQFTDSSSIIQFQTELRIKGDQTTIFNSTPLFALESNLLIQLMKSSGFQNIELFSNFKEEPFGGNHIPLVAMARKLSYI